MGYEEKNCGTEQPHRLVLDGRRKLTASGVERVESFDEETIVARTVQGTLVIRGAGLHLEKLTLDTGEILVQGRIDAAEYEEEAEQSGGFFSRLFK